jgi:16S rRNA (uracil1498-N3)-methyltransferase
LASSIIKLLSRVYFPDDIPAHGRCMLPAAQAHHVARVLRLQVGEALTLFDGRGNEYPAVIAEIAKSRVVIQVGDGKPVDREPPIAVTLAQAISSAERMDYTVQKAVELGVKEIQPLQSARSVVRLDQARAQRRREHWQSIAIAACEQCGRNRIPRVLPVKRFSEWLGELLNERARVMLSPVASVSIKSLPMPRSGITILAGPEGGLTPEEGDDARRSGFVAVRLGPRILRTETAAVAALAAMQTLWGDY